MKKIARVLIASVVLFFAISAAKAQIIVHVRPHPPRSVVIVRRPHRPSARHVWIAEEWTPNGATYVYHPGYWGLPPNPAGVWIAGHWANRRGGYVWIAGHWR